MDMIVAVSAEWGIGKNNTMLFFLPKDLKFFKEMTLGKIVIMGRKTLDALPGGLPLKDRTNLVLTRDPQFQREGVTVFHSQDDLLNHLSTRPDDEAVVIGGEEIYRLFLPYCQRAFVTRIETCAPDADTFFPDLDMDPEWKIISSSETLVENGLRFRFCTYQRI